MGSSSGTPVASSARRRCCNWKGPCCNDSPSARDLTDMRSDAQLLSAARTDPHAFRELYERYAGRVHGFHLGRTRDYEAALDLTAETFAHAWLSRSRFEDRANGSAAPWLFAIARNVLVTSVRRNRLERFARERLDLLREERPAEQEPEERWLEGLDEA